MCDAIRDAESVGRCVQGEVKKCLHEFKTSGANFLVSAVDLANPNAKPTASKRILCDDKQLKVNSRTRELLNFNLEPSSPSTSTPNPRISQLQPRILKSLNFNPESSNPST
jgi:hypothetical protein